jgi:2-dehydro-3-deoxyphosphogluconate aldolase/(4S)-4-hydroxy-2-oxoglutarate aldolase
MDTLSKILHHKIIAIIRGVNPNDFLNIAGALYDGGIRVLEVTLNTPGALSLINQASVQLGEKVLVGAGTVLDAASAIAAVEAGARFIISPDVNLETIRVTKQLGAISIPGAFTATEILTAYNNGGDIIKIFPASVGANYFADMRGPLPHIRLMPTGGVNLANIQDFKKAGAVAFGIGSALVDARLEMTKQHLQLITEAAKRFDAAVADL